MRTYIYCIPSLRTSTSYKYSKYRPKKKAQILFFDKCAMKMTQMILPFSQIRQSIRFL